MLLIQNYLSLQCHRYILGYILGPRLLGSTLDAHVLQGAHNKGIDKKGPGLGGLQPPTFLKQSCLQYTRDFTLAA